MAAGTTRRRIHVRQGCALVQLAIVLNMLALTLHTRDIGEWSDIPIVEIRE